MIYCLLYINILSVKENVIYTYNMQTIKCKGIGRHGDRVTHPCNVETMWAEVSFWPCNIFFRLYVHCSNYWHKHTPNCLSAGRWVWVSCTYRGYLKDKEGKGIHICNVTVAPMPQMFQSGEWRVANSHKQISSAPEHQSLSLTQPRQFCCRNCHLLVCTCTQWWHTRGTYLCKPVTC